MRKPFFFAWNWKIGLDAILQNYGELTRPVALERPFCNPVSFIRGARSNYIEDHDLPMIRKMFPQAELVDIPDAGHWVHAEAPEEFFLAVVKFLHGRLSTSEALILSQHFRSRVHLGG